MRYLLIVLLLGGCAGGAWYKKSATRDDFAADNAVCETRAIEASKQGSARERDIFMNCMLGRGWRFSR